MDRPVAQTQRPAGWPRASRAGARAFTLIELILVMAMLLIVLAVAAPSLSSFFRGRSLDSEARRFLSLTRFGQSRAISEGIPILLWIDTQQRAYGLQADVGFASEPKPVQFQLQEDLQVEVIAASTGNFAMTTPATGLTVIRFLPDGRLGEGSPENVIFQEVDQSAVVISQSRNRLNYEIQTNATLNARR